MNCPYRLPGIMPRDGRMVIGVIAGPHGIKGEMRVNSFLVGNLDLNAVAEVHLAKEGAHSGPFNLIKARPGKNGYIFRLEGIDTREAAEGLTGSEIEVDEALLPELEEGEYYWGELVGMMVKTPDGRILGKVESLIPTGAQALLVLKREGVEILIPAIEPIVVSIDRDAGVITVDPPEGLLDL